MHSSYPTNIGDLLKELRRSKGWSQPNLSERSQVPLRTIQRIEGGKTRRPNVETLQCLAIAFEIDVDVLKEACWHGRASATMQAVTSSPDTDERVPLSLQHTIEPTIPRHTTQPQRWLSRFGRKQTVTSGSVVLLCLLLGAGYLFFFSPLTTSKSVAIAGQVSCADNLRVSGVYIKVEQGVSGMANTHKLNLSGSVTHFAYTLSQGSAYNVHVGCGNAGDAWLNPDDTDFGSGAVKDYAYHSFICRDTPLVNGNGACYMTQ
jgi:transcriptional regulator with XRE-family HTH domain